MKKRFLTITAALLLLAGIAVAVIFLSCNDNVDETNANATNTETPDETKVEPPDETNEETGELVTGILPNGEPIIWGNLINFPIGEDGYWFGVMYQVLDFLQPHPWGGGHWYEQGYTFEPLSDLTTILGQSISTREEAAYIAKQILKSEGFEIDGLELVIRRIEHDPNQDIWIFRYGPNNNNWLGRWSPSVAVSGDGELLRMWVS